MLRKNTEDVERIEYDHLCKLEEETEDFESSYKEKPGVVVAKKGAYMTSLILMGYAIRFCQALANADFAYLEANLGDQASGFGADGKVK